MLKRIIIAAIITPFVLVVIGVVGIWVALAWPTLLINDTTLGMAARHLAPLGIRVSWQRVAVQAEAHGLLEKTLTFSFDDVCVAVRPTLTRSCFSTATISGRYRFEGIIPTLVAIGPVSLANGDVDVVIPQTDEDAAKSKKVEGRIPLASFTMPGIIHQAKVFPVDVAIDQLAIHQGDTTYAGTIKIAGSPDDNHHLSDIAVTANIAEKKMGHSAEVDLKLASASGFTRDDARAAITVDAKLGSAGYADVKAELVMNDGPILDHDIAASYRKDALAAKATLKGTIAENEISTTIAGNVLGIPGLDDAVTSINLPACTITHLAKGARNNDGALSFACHPYLALRKIKLPPDLAHIYKPPERLGIAVNADLTTFFMPQMDHPTSGTVHIAIDPLSGKLVRTTGGITAKVSGAPNEPLTKWNVDANMDIDFVIDEFAKVVKVMSATEWPMPAPFNQLTGMFEFSLEGTISNISNLGHFPVKLSTRLRSPEQTIDIDSEGTLELAFGRADSRADLELDVSLNDVQLQLPNIAMAGIPRFTPDKRIILNPATPKKKKKNEMPFDYTVHVTTPADHPVRVLSNLTPKHAPIVVDVVLTNEGVSGTIAMTTFPIKLFSREATLDRMNFDLTEPMEASTIDGSISFEFPELVAIIAMRGPLMKPRITLESKPPMAQGDIISTILYGQTMDDIDSDQAESVSSMNAAMANRAMALTSFFLLGSTPIQSVAYNPDTGMFTANVKLGKKTSLVVGGGSSQKQAMVRQRLGKGFSISAGAEQTDDDSNMGGTAYIEWSKRF